MEWEAKFHSDWNSKGERIASLCSSKWENRNVVGQQGKQGRRGFVSEKLKLSDEADYSRTTAGLC